MIRFWIGFVVFFLEILFNFFSSYLRDNDTDRDDSNIYLFIILMILFLLHPNCHDPKCKRWIDFIKFFPFFSFLWNVIIYLVWILYDNWTYMMFLVFNFPRKAKTIDIALTWFFFNECNIYKQLSFTLK